MIGLLWYTPRKNDRNSFVLDQATFLPPSAGHAEPQEEITEKCGPLVHWFFSAGGCPIKSLMCDLSSTTPAWGNAQQTPGQTNTHGNILCVTGLKISSKFPLIWVHQHIEMDVIYWAQHASQTPVVCRKSRVRRVVLWSSANFCQTRWEQCSSNVSRRILV